MIRIVGTIFAGLLGLAFGSFLNVCLSRWPEGESIVHPRSHCRGCGRTLAWWENVPVVSWLALRGRCRTCKASISLRYPLVELAVGVLWAIVAWNALSLILLSNEPSLKLLLMDALSKMVFYWLLIALAALDAELLWLPNFITLPGIGLGLILTTIVAPVDDSWWVQRLSRKAAVIDELMAIIVAACVILVTRWIYWLIRRREGVGLGDAKLMAMLAAWLGLPDALLSFAIGVVLGAIAALVLLLLPSTRKNNENWAHTKLPLGTILCIGGIVSSLWGEPMIRAYLHWAGF
ncbi:MAG TPA: prepilin peptidase [Terracidiphilus sp.]|nr:prepilin peptidase [Terracidiphilus sp.]